MAKKTAISKINKSLYLQKFLQKCAKNVENRNVRNKTSESEGELIEISKNKLKGKTLEKLLTDENEACKHNVRKKISWEDQVIGKEQRNCEVIFEKPQFLRLMYPIDTNCNLNRVRVIY